MRGGIGFDFAGVRGDAQSVLLDVNQSPFNVGRRVDLEAFSIEEVATLAAGSGADADAVFALAGGHPQLTAMLVARGTQREEASAVTESIRPSSLMRHLGSRLDGPLRSAVAAVMKGQAPAPDELWMLVGLGLVSLRADGTAIPANRIFAEWMAKKLRS